ncbi:response regulator transcription factor [Flaviaesturariibacter amylovorans]|uniref:Response regulator transcription factor n=1 Tax=Flaviaesturariibacter amylovorans TaxID=1084520 RepID=A0ABP8HHT1_9BACT
MSVKVALADDHILLRNGLADHLKSIGYDVLFQADHGKSLISQLNPSALPDIVLMDINMPQMDGYETTAWLRTNHPSIKVLALSMYDDEKAIIRMIKSGAKGYILKDSEPAELHQALTAVYQKGFYHSELVSGRLIYTINHFDDSDKPFPHDLFSLSKRELEFLKLACSELTYKEIADQMHLSPRTIDGYRDGLFEKLELKSRVGLVLFAIKNGIITP